MVGFGVGEYQMIDYPFTVIVQFRNSAANSGLGTLDELDWRHTVEDQLGGLLEEAGIGECDGGQSGAGTMEVFLYTSDRDRTVRLVQDDLTDRELIGFTKIVSASNDDSETDFAVHYPQGGTFSLWRFE